jgi:hypothetical protein
MIKRIFLFSLFSFVFCQAEAMGKRGSNPAPQSAKGARAPTASGYSILKYADTGVGSPYVWGGSSWSTGNRNALGADCSGFTQKAWAYPELLNPETSLGNSRISTKEFMKAQDGGYPWTRLDKLQYTESQPGDAMVRWDGSEGHIFLVSKTDNSGVTTLEAKGRKYGIGYSRRSYAKLQSQNYKIIRRK